MNKVPTSLTRIDRSQAERLLAEHLHGDTACDAIATDCTLLRSCIWALTRAIEPVHVLRIPHLALAVWESEEGVVQQRERLREALEELADIGDLISLPKGYWLPAPTREVLLERDSDERLLVGGLPTSALPKALQCQIIHHGPYRRMRGPTLGEILTLPRENVDSWTGTPPESLGVWAEHLLSIDLTPYQSTDESRLLIYAPELVAHRIPQAKRWFERPAAISGRYLAARTRIFGVREYRIVELKEGIVVAIGDFPAPGESRRLMYALDVRARKSVDVRVRTENDRLALTLRSELPRSDQRLFATIGTLEVCEEAYYPRTWWFAERYRNVILPRLHDLGITIVELTTRRPQI